MADNITVWDGQNQIAYKNLCGIYCNDSNAAVLAFLQATLNDTSRSSFKLTFPNAEALQKKIFIGYSIGDLKFEQGYVTEAKMVILHYMVDTSLPNGRQLAADFETKVRNFFSSITDISHHIKYSVLSRTRELEEQRYIYHSFKMKLFSSLQSNHNNFSSISRIDYNRSDRFHATYFSQIPIIHKSTLAGSYSNEGNCCS